MKYLLGALASFALCTAAFAQSDPPLTGPAALALFIVFASGLFAGGILSLIVGHRSTPAPAPPAVDINLLLGLLHKLVMPTVTANAQLDTKTAGAADNLATRLGEFNSNLATLATALNALKKAGDK